MIDFSDLELIAICALGFTYVVLAIGAMWFRGSAPQENDPPC